MRYKRIPITLADGSVIHTAGRGDVGEFKDVNYTPDFKHNLLSVNQLTLQGYTVTFTIEGNVIVQSCEGTQQLGTFNEGVYTTTNHNKALPSMALGPVIVRDQTTRYMRAPSPASDLVHQRWGHAFIKRIMDAQSQGLVQGFHTSVQPIHFCDACARAKLHQTSSTQTPNIQEGEPDVMRRLHRVSCDVSGKIHIKGYQNVQYFVMFIDQATRYMWIIFVVDVTTQSMIAAFDQFYIKVQQAQEVIGELHILKTFKTDCASSFKDEAFVSHLSARGVKPEYSAPNSHYQNSLAERAIRTIRGMGMCQMLHAKVPPYLWPYAFRQAVFINNRLPTTILGKRTTPFIEMFHFIPDARHIRVFGCDAYALIHDGKKHGPKAYKGLHLGQDDTSTGYLIYNPQTRRVSITVHVKFNEDVTVQREWSSSDEGALVEEADRYSQDEVSEAPSSHAPVAPHSPIAPLPVCSEPIAAPSSPHDSPVSSSPDVDAPDDTPDTAIPQRRAQEQRSWDSDLRKSTRSNKSYVTEVQKALVSGEFIVKDDEMDSIDMFTIDEVDSSEARAKWLEAIDSEVQSLIDKQTWHIIKKSEMPRGRTLVNYKWVFKVKFDETDNVQKYKARLCAKGFTQKEGIDYTETFSPVA